MPFSDMNIMDDADDPYLSAYQQWSMSSGPDANAKVLKDLDPVITRVARSQVSDLNPSLKSQAKRLTLNALKTYNPKKSKLETHIWNNLKGLKRHAAKQQQVISVPERLALDKLRLNEAEQALELELGRSPSDEELANRSGLSYKRMQRLRSYNPSASQGFFESMNEGFSPAVESPSKIWPELVYTDLGPVDQKILEWMTGLHGHKTLGTGEIASKLNLSPGAVSQRKAKINQLLSLENEMGMF